MANKSMDVSLESHDNLCDLSSANILDTAANILATEIEEVQKDLLKFKYSRKKNLQVNFGKLRRVKFINGKIVLQEPKEEQVGSKVYYLGPDCRVV